MKKVKYVFLRKAGTGVAAMLSNLIVQIVMVTVALAVGLLLGSGLLGNVNIGIQAMKNMFGG